MKAAFTSQEIPWYSLEAESTRGHIVVENVVSMKNSNDTIGNRTGDFLARSALPQCALNVVSGYCYLR